MSIGSVIVAERDALKAELEKVKASAVSAEETERLRADLERAQAAIVTSRSEELKLFEALQATHAELENLKAAKAAEVPVVPAALVASSTPIPESTGVIDRLRRESISLHTELSHAHEEAEEQMDDHLRAVAALSGTIKMLEQKNSELTKQLAAAGTVAAGSTIVSAKELVPGPATPTEIAPAPKSLAVAEDPTPMDAPMTVTLPPTTAAATTALAVSAATRSPSPSEPLDRLRRESISLHSELSHLHHEAEEERNDHLRTVGSLTGSIQILEAKIKEQAEALRGHETRVAEANAANLKREKMLKDLRNAVAPAGVGIGRLVCLSNAD